VDQLGEPLTRVISWIAGASLILGSLAAIPQTNLKRLLGYSSITHAGFLLLALSCCQDGSVRGLEAALIYILLYVPAALLAFFILSAASRQLPGGEISALAGLGRRSPVLAFGMLSALVSMAGIPPLAGFVGKFAVLAAAWESGSLRALCRGRGRGGGWGVLLSWSRQSDVLGFRRKAGIFRAQSGDTTGRRSSLRISSSPRILAGSPRGTGGLDFPSGLKLWLFPLTCKP
jgi:NADH:ubiquinone oxidoreductase subunit 5 (subunit L)/multisubunit Na+/H+ antiporter MnhA subunit